MNALNIGIIGLGLMGERHVRVYHKMPLVNVYAVCDANEARAREMAERYGAKAYTDLEHMLADPELTAVDIVLPDNMHRRAVELAVQYGKHIMIEKPMACTVEDAEKMYEVLKDYDKTFMIGHILRFDARYSTAREAVQRGQVGDVVSVYARRNSPIDGPRHYRGATDIDTHVMVHDIDAIQWILGSKIRTVFARSSNHVLGEIGMTDCIHTIFTTDSGAMGTMEACWILPSSSPTSIDDLLEIIGSKAVVYTSNCGAGVTVVDAARADEPDLRHWPELNGDLSGALYEELTDFVRCVLGEKPSCITAEEGLYIVKVVDAIRESIRTKSEVTID